MPRYQVGGMVLDSNVSLPELQHQPCLKFQLCYTSPPLLPNAGWAHRFDEAGEVWLSVAKTAAHYVLRFPHEAEFHVALPQQQIVCYPSSQASRETIHHLLLDHVLPMILSHAGNVVMHAGAVVTPAGAVAFVGASGAGKSTLTSYFAQQGFPVLTDDFLRLDFQEQIWGVASYPSVRLFPRHLQNLFADTTTKRVAARSEKRRLALRENALNFHPYPAPLRKIFLLAEAPEIKISPVTPMRGFIELVKNSFHLDATDWECWRAKSELFKKITEENLIFRLHYPREIQQLSVVRDVILRELNF